MSMMCFQTFQFLNSLSQLCHSCTDLSHITWLALFPRIWKVLSEKQQQVHVHTSTVCWLGL
ncbi:hypothetical protein DPMN_149494 [Dreissena polymorpha]|uniref:Uncharacterized protein n=1 Tax=Dreissena polymorpha TaxID=45954 RepID=A0A9D4FHH7_DREPO|nr:hypothetical protein DPMN_149494 [Dreissena polymorpha]